MLAAGRASLDRVLDVVSSCVGSNILRAVYVVSGEASPGAQPVAKHDVIVLHAPVASLGALSNVRIGIERALASSPRGRAAVLLVAGNDAGLHRESIVQVVRRWRVSGAAAVRPKLVDSPDRPRPPLLLDRSLWHQAMHLTSEADLDAMIGAASLETVELSSEEPS